MDKTIFKQHPFLIDKCRPKYKAGPSFFDMFHRKFNRMDAITNSSFLGKLPTKPNHLLRMTIFHISWETSALYLCHTDERISEKEGLLTLRCWYKLFIIIISRRQKCMWPHRKRRMHEYVILFSATVFTLNNTHHNKN